MVSAKKTPGPCSSQVFESALHQHDSDFGLPGLPKLTPEESRRLFSVCLVVVLPRRGGPKLYVRFWWNEVKPHDWYKIDGTKEELVGILERFGITESLRRDVEVADFKIREAKRGFERISKTQKRIEQWLVLRPVKPIKSTEQVPTKPTGLASESAHNTVPGVSGARGLGQV